MPQLGFPYFHPEGISCYQLIQKAVNGRGLGSEPMFLMQP
jgi:hypothetical protein